MRRIFSFDHPHERRNARASSLSLSLSLSRSSAPTATAARRAFVRPHVRYRLFTVYDTTFTPCRRMYRSRPTKSSKISHLGRTHTLLLYNHTYTVPFSAHKIHTPRGSFPLETRGTSSHAELFLLSLFSRSSIRRRRRASSDDRSRARVIVSRRRRRDGRSFARERGTHSNRVRFDSIDARAGESNRSRASSPSSSSSSSSSSSEREGGERGRWSPSVEARSRTI